MPWSRPRSWGWHHAARGRRPVGRGLGVCLITSVCSAQRVWFVLLVPCSAWSADLVRLAWAARYGSVACRAPPAGARRRSGAVCCALATPGVGAPIVAQEAFARTGRCTVPASRWRSSAERTPARYYSEGEHVDRWSDAAAQQWLAAPPARRPPGRRWLVLRFPDLPELNSLCREASHNNLAVLDASSGSILLASNELKGAKNETG